MRVLVIGGSGSMSTRITQQAIELGHEVMVASRGKRPLLGVEKAQRLKVDREELRGARPHLSAFSPDVVVDSICFAPDRARDLVDLFPEVRRLVLISTVDVYGEDVGGAPVTEERKPKPVTPYAKAKLECERIVLDGLGPRATVFRPSHILGQTFLTASLWGRSPHLVDRIQKRKPVPAIDGGRNLVTPVYAADVAAWVVRSFSLDAANGQTFNAVGGQIVPQQRYYEAIARTLKVPLELLAVPSSVFRRFVDAPSQFNWHRPYSCEKASRTLDHRPRGTLEAMIRETVEYMLQAGLVRDCEDHPIDDRIVEVLSRSNDALGEVLASARGSA